MRPFPTRPLDVEERLAWLRLIRSEQVGPVNFRKLLDRFGTARAALEALPEMARRAGRRRPIRLGGLADAERELAANAKYGGRILALCEPEYPVPLSVIEDAPPLLFLRGDPDFLAGPCVAMVGSRNASANGRRLARNLAQGLGQAGFTVVSGLARGIDGAAHAGALEKGTVAVLAGGADVVYPPEHDGLYRDIAERGVVISEMPPGTEPQARHFPRRNRLISGLSLGVVVVEAALRSGSLITARCALEQGRELLAVPGSPLDPRARGCNHLLRQGATLVEGPADVTQALLGMAATAHPAPETPETKEPIPTDQEMDKVRRKIEALLSTAPVTLDEVIRQSHLSPAVVSTALMELELAGRAERQSGNRYALGHPEGA